MAPRGVQTGDSRRPDLRAGAIVTMIPPMRHWIARWALIILAIFLVGPIAGQATGAIPALDGGPEAAAFVGRSVVAGVGLTLAAVTIATLWGLLGARLLGARTGLFLAGLVVAWAAGQGATVVGLMRVTGESGTFVSLAIEGGVLLVVGAGMSWAICLVGRATEQDYAEPITHIDNLYGLVAAVLAGGLAAWLLAREGLKGQTLAAGVAAGVAAATIGRLIGQRAQPMIFVPAVMLLAVIGPIAAMQLGGANAVERVFENRISALGLLTPMDWLAGALLGVPMGLAWAASLTNRHGQPAPAPRARPRRAM
jgi:hypothetical protein